MESSRTDICWGHYLAYGAAKKEPQKISQERVDHVLGLLDKIFRERFYSKDMRYMIKD